MNCGYILRGYILIMEERGGFVKGRRYSYVTHRAKLLTRKKKASMMREPIREKYLLPPLEQNIF